MFPARGSIERHHCLEWMLFCTSTIHPLYWGLWRRHRLVSDKSHHDDLDATSRGELLKAYERLENQLRGRQYLLGDEPFACDYYVYIFVRWAYRIFDNLSQYPRLEEYYKGLSELLAVKTALANEGLVPLH